VCAMSRDASKFNQQCHAASLCVWRQPCADVCLNLTHLQPERKTRAPLNPRCSVARTTAEGQAAHKPDEHWCIPSGLTPRLTGAGGRRPQDTKAGHENGEAMASFGVRVEPTVGLGRVGRVGQVHSDGVKVYVYFWCFENHFSACTAMRTGASRPMKKFTSSAGIVNSLRKSLCPSVAPASIGRL